MTQGKEPGPRDPGGGSPNPRLILVLNLLLVCVGYFLIGQWQKGASALGVLIVLTVGTLFLGSPLIPVLIAFTSIDGFLQARQLERGHRIGQWTTFSNTR